MGIFTGLLLGGLLGAYWTRPGGWLGSLHGHSPQQPYQYPTQTRNYPIPYTQTRNYPIPYTQVPGYWYPTYNYPITYNPQWFSRPYGYFGY